MLTCAVAVSHRGISLDTRDNPLVTQSVASLLVLVVAEPILLRYK